MRILSKIVFPSPQRKAAVFCRFQVSKQPYTAPAALVAGESSGEAEHKLIWMVQSRSKGCMLCGLMCNLQAFWLSGLLVILELAFSYFIGSSFIMNGRR